MKTPDESKCGMECIRTNAERICVKSENGQCPRCEQLVEESLISIRQFESTYGQVSKALCGKENATLDELLQAVDQLKSRLAQAERKRDAAIRDLNCNWKCAICKKFTRPVTKCPHYRECGLSYMFWEWRGVCEENTKEDEP